eukprot:2871933-Amphidinium_carterae.1
MSIYNGLGQLALPVEQEHGRTLTVTKTAAGAQSWHTDMWSGQRTDFMCDMWSMLRSTAFATATFLTRQSPVPSLCLTPPEAQDNAKSLFLAVLGYLGEEVLLQEEHMSVPPGCFHGLLAESPEVRTSCAAYCHELWKRLLQLEHDAHTNVTCHNHVQALLWPQWSWIRHLFIALSETNWQELPADIRTELLESTFVVGTKMVEDSINFVRAVKKTNTVGHLGPLAIWQRLQQSGLLADNDVQEVPPLESESSMDVEVLTERDLEAKYNEYSLGDAALQEILAGNTFAHPGPRAMHNIPLATSRVFAGHLDSIRYDLNFISKLGCIGQVLYDSAGHNDEALLVMKVSGHGVVTWRCTSRVLSAGDTVRELVPLQGKRSAEGVFAAPWKLVTLVAPVSRWSMTPVTVLPPLWKPTETQPYANPHASIMLIEDRIENTSLLRAAAKDGFRHCTVPDLQSLIRHMEWSVNPMPHTERDLTATCLEHALPEATAEERQRLFDMRHYRHESRVKGVIDEDAVRGLMGALEPDEAAIAEARLSKAAQGKRKHDATERSSTENAQHTASASSRQHPSSSSGAASSSNAPLQSVDVSATAVQPGATVGRRAAYPADKQFDIHEGRRMCPPGATLAIHTDRSWQVKYPKKPTNPRSKSVTWGPVTGYTYNGALRACLEWAWAAYTEDTKLPSTMDFTGWPA